MANEDVIRQAVAAAQALNETTGDPSSIAEGKSTSKTEKNLAQQLKRLAGIDLGLGALLKQSQIFTGYMGNLFAIIGAIIDTVLAPLAPMAFKALAALGKKIPAIAKAAQEWIPRIVDRVTKIVKGFDGFMKKWWPNWAGTVAKIVGGLVAINLTLRMIRMSGSMAYGITGARGAVGMGRSILGRGSGPVSQAAVAPRNMMGGGLGGFGLGGGGRQAAQVAKASKQASYSSDLFASVAKKGGLSSTTTGLGAKATAMGGRFATAGRMLGRGVPIIGTLAAAGMGYAGGRDKGMSKGKSAGRAGFTAGGAIIGATLGSIVPGAGTMLGGMIGGAAGSFLGPMLFDALFDKKGGGRGGASNLGVGGGVGLSGYTVPHFIAQSAEAFSKTVLKTQTVLDEEAIKRAELNRVNQEAIDLQKQENDNKTGVEQEGSSFKLRNALSVFGDEEMNNRWDVAAKEAADVIGPEDGLMWAPPDAGAGENAADTVGPLFNPEDVLFGTQAYEDLLREQREAKKREMLERERNRNLMNDLEGSVGGVQEAVDQQNAADGAIDDSLLPTTTVPDVNQDEIAAMVDQQNAADTVPVFNPEFDVRHKIDEFVGTVPDVNQEAVAQQIADKQANDAQIARDNLRAMQEDMDESAQFHKAYMQERREAGTWGSPVVNVTLQSNSGNGTTQTTAQQIGSAWLAQHGYDGSDPWL